MAGGGTSTVLEVDVEGKRENKSQVVTAARVGALEVLPAATNGIPYASSGAFTLSVEVSSVGSASGPRPVTLYYRLEKDKDLSSVVSTEGVGQKSKFQIPMPLQEPGPHWLYMYTSCAKEGTITSAGTGSGSSPLLTEITPFLYIQR